MPLPGQFKKPGARAATSTPAAGTRPGRRSRYAGLKAREPSAPRLPPGTFRLRVVRHDEGANPGKGTESFKCYWRVVDLLDEAAQNSGVAIGSEAFESFRTLGSGATIQLETLKSYAMAAAGYDDEGEFDAFAGEDGEFIDAVAGDQNRYRGPDDGDPLEGREFFVEVRRGNATADGSDFYRNYVFGSTAEETGRLVLRDRTGPGCDTEGPSE